MRPSLADLVAPAHTAIVTQECQGAVVGPDAGLAALASGQAAAIKLETRPKLYG